MKDLNDLMQAILDMDAAQRKATEAAKAERAEQLGRLDAQRRAIADDFAAKAQARSQAAAAAAAAAWLRAWALAAKSSAMARRCASSRPSCSARSALAASVALRCAASISRIACIKSFRSFMLSPRKESLLPFRDLL